jgi:TRAP-type C4-dicarboxylate transport system substrate-binding protein
MKLRPFRLPFHSVRRFRLSARILGLALAGLASVRADEHVTIRLGTLVPTGTAQYAALQAMAEQWRHDSGGDVKIVLYPDGRLGGETEMVKKMRIKQLGACVLTAVGLAEIDQGSTGLQEMPLAFHSWAEVDFVREKMRPMLEQRLRAKGYEVLFWADAGWVRYFSKDAGLTPDDFRKMKIFTWSGDVRQSEIMKSVGYRPVGLDTTDILLGLNTDMISVVPLPPLLALAAQLYGPAPHMLDLKWSPIVGAAVIRSDLWEKIPPALQEKFRQSASLTGEKLRAAGRSEDEDCIHVMEGKGLKVTPLTPAAAAAWQELADEVLPKIRGSVVPTEIFDDVNRFLAEYRKSVPAGQP